MAVTEHHATPAILRWICAVFSILIFAMTLELLVTSRERGEEMRRIEQKIDALGATHGR